MGKICSVKRADFVEPTEHSVICNIHFSPDCCEKKFYGGNGAEEAKAVSFWCNTVKTRV